MASSTPREPTLRPRAPPCARTTGSASTTPSSRSSPSGSAAGQTPTRLSTTALPTPASARPRRSASTCAPRGCVRRQNSRRSPARRRDAMGYATELGRAQQAARRSPRRGRGASATRRRRRLAPTRRGGIPPRPRRLRPQAWAEAAAAWERLERPPLAAYCCWREAEALAAGASRVEASVPLRERTPSQRASEPTPATEIELLAERARLDIAAPGERHPTASQASRRLSD